MGQAKCVQSWQQKVKCTRTLLGSKTDCGLCGVSKGYLAFYFEGLASNSDQNTFTDCYNPHWSADIICRINYCAKSNLSSFRWTINTWTLYNRIQLYKKLALEIKLLVSTVSGNWFKLWYCNTRTFSKCEKSYLTRRELGWADDLRECSSIT